MENYGLTATARKFSSLEANYIHFVSKTKLSTSGIFVYNIYLFIFLKWVFEYLEMEIRSVPHTIHATVRKRQAGFTFTLSYLLKIIQ